MGTTRVFGFHAVNTILNKNPERIKSLTISSDRHDAKMNTLLQLAHEKQIKIIKTSRQELDKLSGSLNHQGVIAICLTPKKYVEEDLITIIENAHSPLLFLILDGVQDPHNLGACL